MWNPTARARYSRAGLRYGSDLTDKEWAIVEPLLPPACRRGRHRRWEWREVLDAIFYVPRAGCPWRLLPDSFPPWRTVYRWFCALRDSGGFEALNDRVQIQQVLINLLRNAVEAMVDSPVRQLRISSGLKSAQMVRVTVADTGPGLAPEIANELFRAFQSTKQEGMGLGLSICRTIVEAHGGRIWADSQAAAGTTFHFTLMLAGGEGTLDG